jgi:hypothetical protein
MEQILHIAKALRSKFKLYSHIYATYVYVMSIEKSKSTTSSNKTEFLDYILIFFFFNKII